MRDFLSMTEERYQRISAPFRGKEKLVTWANRLLTNLTYVCYPLLLLLLAIQWDVRFWKALLVPAISFVLLTLVRKKIDAPRPYQVLNIDPLIHKDTQGKSMPSRHVFSIFIIAATWLWIVPAVGMVFLVFGTLLACLRVIGGVHFPRDVLVGALVGLACGLVGYVLIP
jgi:membrane-associated phospholipid phosphatase